eukprot:6031025-Karenia_brevis.AAC.1
MLPRFRAGTFAGHTPLEKGAHLAIAAAIFMSAMFVWPMVRHAVRSTPGSSTLAKEDASDRRRGHLHRGQGVRNFLLGQR